MYDLANPATTDGDQPLRTTTACPGMALASLPLGLLALTACGGPSLNSPEGLQQEQDREEMERENHSG